LYKQVGYIHYVAWWCNGEGTGLTNCKVTTLDMSGASLDLHVTMLTVSLILTLRLTLNLQPYPNPTDPNPNCNPGMQI